MNKRKVLIGSAAALTLLIGAPVFAATPAVNSTKTPGVIGTVQSVNGNTITVKNRKGTTYTVDASNITIMKGVGKKAGTLPLSGVAVNDKIVVEGTVSGSTVAPERIIDGVTGYRAKHLLAQAVFGTVQSVNGNTITLSHANKSGATNVTVNVTSSTVYRKNDATISESNLAVGDKIVAMGTKDSNGNVVTAARVHVFVGKNNK